MSFSSGRNISNNVNTDEAQTLTNKTIDSANNSLVIDADTATVSNIEADNLKAGVIDNDLSSTSVNDDTVPSAKAAKAYTDAAASTASSNLTTHETSTTGVHGVTGDIVGTSDTQTLTNKTITGADIRTPTRSDVKQDTRANLDIYATTAADGQTVYATDEKKYYGIVDNALVALGGGLGSPQTVSVIQADDLQVASDFSGQNTDIVTGGVASNGTLNGTLSLSSTASELLTGVDKVIKYIAGASSQFDYFGHTHAIPQGFAGRTLAVELTYRTAAGYTNGDFTVEILSFNGTTASYLSNKIKLLDSKESADGNGKTVRFLVNVPSDCETLKVAFQNLSATSGITFFVDKISVDIDDFNYKEVNAATEWESYTPTYTGFGTVSSGAMFYKVVGDTLQIRGTWIAGTTTATTAKVTIPNGYTIDTNKIKSSQIQSVGVWMRGAFASINGGSVNIIDTDTNELYFSGSEVFGGSSANALGQANADSMINSGEVVSIPLVTLPIVEGKADATFLAAVPTQLTAYLKDVQDSTSAGGGTFTSGAWRTRPLNTVSGDSQIVSLSSNQFTLSPGKYEIEAILPANRVDRHLGRLRDITNSSTIVTSHVAMAEPAENVTNTVTLMTTLDISSSTTYEVQHACQTTRATDGFGRAHENFVPGSEDNVYAQVKITKIK